MQTLKFMPNKLTYLLSPLTMGDADARYGRLTDTILETDNSSSSSPRHDFSDWCSRRSSPLVKSDRGSEDEDDEADEVLSVGCESPPPATASDALPKKRSSADGQASLKFSIDNILRPDFGEPTRKRAEERAAEDSPVDLSQEGGRRTTKLKTERGRGSGNATDPSQDNNLWPAWVYCTRYSDRPSSGRSPRMRIKRKEKRPEEKRPRTAFTGEQLGRLKKEFNENNYLTEKRRQELATELGLHEAQIKIWFQNKRAKIKKASGTKNPLALKLMAEGLYNHSTLQAGKDEKET